jgi:glycerophosphoryl diester phosphodiesterase
LTPLVSFGVRSLISLSGSAVLADQDILAFALGPVGIATLVAAAAGRIAVLALGQACLMGIAFGAARGRRVAAVSALVWGAAKTLRILAVTTRLAARVLVVCAPFLALSGLVYLLFLTDFDINYYLTERPPAFWIAAVLIGMLLLVMTALLLRTASGWVYALPLLLFENVEPSKALRSSEERAHGHRAAIGVALFGWAAATALVSLAGFSTARALAAALLSQFRESLHLLVPALGIVFGLGVGTSALFTAFASSAFAALVVALYEKLGAGSRARAPTGDENAGPAPILNGKRVLLGVLAAAALAAGAGWVLLRGGLELRPVTVIAHRGGAVLAPENTLAAVERGIAAGTDWVEIDVQETADGEVVVVHDSDFMKLAGSPLKVWEGSFAEVRKLDIGSSFGPEFRGEGVPTLEEVLLRAKDKAKVVIELKYYGHDERLEERVAEIVERTGMENEIAIMSLERAGVEKMAALRPAYRKGLLAATAIGRLAEVDVDFLAVSVNLARPPLIRQAHALGRDVYVWTVNDEVSMAHQILRGADGLITDDPARAQAVIRAASDLTPVERLLLGAAFWLGVEPARFQISRDSE